MGMTIWFIVSGIISGIGIAFAVVGVKVFFSNIYGGHASMEGFVEEDMRFIQEIDL